MLLVQYNRHHTSAAKMKLSLGYSLFYTTLLFPQLKHSLTNFLVTAASSCAPDPLEYNEEVGMMVEKVGSVPTNTTAAWSYNMDVADNFDEEGLLFFLDQAQGRIYSYSEDSAVTKVWDMAEDEIPSGLDLSWSLFGPAQRFKVHSMSQGSKPAEVYVVFSSTSLPTGWTEPDAPLPAPDKYYGYVCHSPANNKTAVFVRDLYRMGVLPDCFDSGAGTKTVSVYDVFYKFNYDSSSNLLSNPDPFFVIENQLSPGHLGGGIATLNSGQILYSTGDCLPFGFDGGYAAQDDNESCGKILKINPKIKGSYKVVAKGVRNSQQMKIQRKPKSANGKNRDVLVFMDIGGVTAEEVNKIKVSQIANTKTIDNFGWGRSYSDGKAREGTFYIAPGSGGNLGGDPACEGPAPVPEEGFINPWIQFGRTATDFFYAISGFAVSKKSFNKLKLFWTEFNTGLVLGTMEVAKQSTGPSKGYKIKLYDTNMTELEGGFNDLVKEELGEVFYYRGDPRPFHYPDGTAGVFIERTGVFYKLTEIDLGA